MPTNMRSKPIEGHITDSAGNVIRNSVITVKSSMPLGDVVVDTVTSDGTGYFVTQPLPNGTYTLHESGIVVSKIRHNPDITIQCYKPHPYNYPASNVNPFDYLLESGKLQRFVYYLQIEPEELDISIGGSSFPMYNYHIGSMVLSAIYASTDRTNDMYHMKEFHAFNDETRITTTRFDVEYFTPLTGLSRSYKRVRWAGVPGIRFKEDSKIVVPLDYMSIVPSLPKTISRNGEDFLIYEGMSHTFFPDIYVESVDGISPLAKIVIVPRNENAEYESIKNGLVIGDIVYISFLKPTDPYGSVPQDWYGVYEGVDDDDHIILREWMTSNKVIPTMTLGSGIVRMSIFDGMFAGISNINELANRRFSVIENMYAQDASVEMYSYNKATEVGL